MRRPWAMNAVRYQGGIFLGNLGTGFPQNPFTSGKILWRSYALLIIYTSKRNEENGFPVVGSDFVSPVKRNDFLGYFFSKEMLFF